MGYELLQELCRQASAQGSRSTVLKPLGWLTAICFGGVVSIISQPAATWLIVLCSVCLALSVLAYLGAYIFCLIVDRDALRSEKFTIQKMAIEKGFIGDSKTGVVELQSIENKSISVCASDDSKGCTR